MVSDACRSVQHRSLYKKNGLSYQHKTLQPMAVAYHVFTLRSKVKVTCLKYTSVGMHVHMTTYVFCFLVDIKFVFARYGVK